MSGRSYQASLDDLLVPLGFVRDGQDWNRLRDGVEETVGLQVSNVAGTTANLRVCNLESARLVDEILGEKGHLIMTHTQRIGHLIDGFDRWWRRDPNGPAQLAEAVRIYGLPFIDKMRAYDEQWAKGFDQNDPGRWHGPSLILLAITLYRTGEVERARAALRRPDPRTAPRAWVDHVAKVRSWLEGQ